MLSYQTFVAFPSLCFHPTLYCFINLFHVIKLSSYYQTFVTFSPFVIYPFYFIYAPYNCTCTTHQATQLLPSSYRAHALCANTLSTSVFGHRAILMRGDQSLADCFQLEQPDSFNDKVLKHMKVATFILKNRLFFISLISLQISYILLLQLILKYPIYLM